ncbi:MAG TPA: recombinase RecT [Pseudonocardiaceae bacterium]|jgi:recombination protein RecT
MHDIIGKARAAGVVITGPDTDTGRTGPAKPELTIFDEIRARQDSFAQALTDTGIDPAAFVENAVNYVRTDMLRTDSGKKIAECDADSVIGALLNCAQMGLRPGAFDEAWIIPRGGKAAFHANYKALRRLALEHPSVLRIEAEAVRQNDEFEMQKGSNNILLFKEKLAPNSERGGVKYFYALAKMANGESHFRWMHTDDMAQFARMYGGGGASSQWKSGYGYVRMGVKTILLRLLDELPRAKKLIELSALDGTVRTDLNPAAPGYEVSAHDEDSLDTADLVDLDALAPPDPESPEAQPGT